MYSKSIIAAINRIRSNTVKTAKLEVEKGNILTRVPAHALGGVFNTANLMPAITKDLSPYREGDIEEIRQLAEALEQEYPQELGDAKIIQGGGTRLLDTLKRHFTNKRTGPLGKTVGLPLTLTSSAFGGLLRQPLYSPFADEIYAPWDNLGTDIHELGHAIDYNSNPIEEGDSFLKRQGKKLKRDIYPFTRALPGGALYQELKAWKRADEAIKRLLSKHTLSEKTEDRLVDNAAQVRTPALTSYVGQELGRFIPQAGLAGNAGALAMGLTSVGKNRLKKYYRKDIPERQSEETPEENSEKEKPKVKNKTEDKDKDKEKNIPTSKAASMPQMLKDAAWNCRVSAFSRLTKQAQGVKKKMKTAASPLGGLLKLLGKGVVGAAKGVEKRVVGTGKAVLPWAGVASVPYLGQKGFMDFVYPQLKSDFGGTFKEIKEGVPIMTREYLDRSGEKISDTIDNAGKKITGATDSIQKNVSDAAENTLVGTGDKINQSVDFLTDLGKQVAGHTVWSTSGGIGAMLGWKILKEVKKQRIRDAERFRNDAYRKLQRDESLGNISQGQYDATAKDLEKETAKREKYRFRDYVLPALTTAGGIGAGYLGYKHITGQ
jgi:hypothetical protein